MHELTALNLPVKARIKLQPHHLRELLYGLFQRVQEVRDLPGEPEFAQVNLPVGAHLRAGQHHLLQLRWDLRSLVNPLRYEPVLKIN